MLVRDSKSYLTNQDGLVFFRATYCMQINTYWILEARFPAYLQDSVCYTY